MWTTCFHRLFFTPEPSNVIILFFSSLHFCSLVVTASRRICHDPALGSNAFFHVYAAEMQRLVPVWTVPMASGADLHNSMLVFACWEGTLVSRQLLFAIRDSYWGRLHQPKVFFLVCFILELFQASGEPELSAETIEVCPNWRSSKVWIDMKLSWLNHQYKNQYKKKSLIKSKNHPRSSNTAALSCF